MKRFTRAVASAGSWLVLSVLVIDALLVYTSMRTITRSYEPIDRSRRILAELERTLSFIKDAETGQRGYLLTGHDDYLEPFRAAEAGLAEGLARLRSLTSDNEVQQAHTDDLRQLAAEKMAELRETIELRRGGDLDAALRIVLTDRGQDVMRRTRSVAAGIRAEEDRLLAIRTAASESAVRRTVATFTLTTGLSLLLLVGVSSLQRREVKQREQAAAAIGESEAWLATTLTSVGDALIATDERGHVRFMNPIAEILTGWSQVEAAGKPMETIFNIINEDTRKPVGRSRARRNGPSARGRSSGWPITRSSSRGAVPRGRSRTVPPPSGTGPVASSAWCWSSAMRPSSGPPSGRSGRARSGSATWPGSCPRSSGSPSPITRSNTTTGDGSTIPD